MDLKPPSGSNISIVTDGTDPMIVIPNTGGGTSRYFPGLFLLFWLGGWAMGFWSALSTILSGKATAFIVFWLGGWTVAGGLVGLTVFRLFRPVVPETLTLRRRGVTYDSGIPPFRMNNWYGQNRSRMDYWKEITAKRVRLDFDRRQLQSLRLRETDSGNRLTIDNGASRLDIAAAASEVEREWLLRLLSRRYSLAMTPGEIGEQAVSAAILE
jgi:hypothetical protein